MQTTPENNAVISHKIDFNNTNRIPDETIEEAVDAIKNRLKQAESSLPLPLNDAISMLTQLSKFNFGRSLIYHQGLNGYWTQHMVLHPYRGRITGLNDEGKPFTKMEQWLLDKCPVILATQQRYDIFIRKIQENVKSNITLSAIPCGMMDVLFSIDYSKVDNVQLFGIDLDEQSLILAKENAKNYADLAHINLHFLQRDAWHLGLEEQFDLIASNGLNIYEPNRERQVSLYDSFRRALKKGGKLVISFLTPPPALSKESPWKNFNLEDVKLQKVILADILNLKFQTYFTEEEMRARLNEAGLKTIEVIYDNQCLFPTVIAEK